VLEFVDELEVEGEEAAEEAEHEQQVLGPGGARARVGLGLFEADEEVADVAADRIADGKIAERWAGWKPGRAPVR
jgi:hypothetical protein